MAGKQLKAETNAARYGGKTITIEAAMLNAAHFGGKTTRSFDGCGILLPKKNWKL